MNKIFAAVFGLLFFLCSSCAAYSPQGYVFVTMFDVGQGDSFLIETPEKNILLDAGDVNSPLVDKLKAAGIERLERVILTHPHADHIGGVKAVLDNFTVDLIYDNGQPSRSPLWKNYHASGVPCKKLIAGDVLDLGGGVKFNVLFPTQFLLESVNDRSIVGKLTFGDFSILFTGDIDSAAEDELIQLYDLRATILKAAHHGSRSSSSADFVANVNPQFVLISAGSKFNHPHKQTLATFRENFILPDNIFCTRFNGDVRIESDGHNFIILPQRAPDWLDDFTGESLSVTRLD